MAQNFGYGHMQLESGGSTDPNNVTRKRRCEDGDFMKAMAEENAVIVFGVKGCCFCLVLQRLLQGLGVNPAVCEINDGREKEMGPLKLPMVFIGGRWFGGVERMIAAHIAGELTPRLKRAGALWL